MHPYRESISAICIAAAWSDGHMEEFEKQALDRVHVQLGFDRAEIMERIGLAAKSGPSGESVEIPNDPQAQQEFMRFALAVCLADGTINDHEVVFLSKLANFLSITPQKLEELKSAAEKLLNPSKAALDDRPPDRIDALLPDQFIKLDQRAQSEQGKPAAKAYDPKDCVRKPLSELLYEGEDYGGELSLL